MRLKVLVAGTMALMPVAMNAQTFSWQGVGPVRLGMTAAEAERALNAKLGPVEQLFSKECYVTGRADAKDEAVQYVIVNSRITVINVFLPGDKQPDPNIVDANGIGIGSPEADVFRSYKQAKRELAPYFRESDEQRAESAKELAKQGITEPAPHYSVTAESSDRRRQIIFDTQDGTVRQLRIGLKPDVTSIEDCI